MWSASGWSDACHHDLGRGAERTLEERIGLMERLRDQLSACIGYCCRSGQRAAT